MVLLAALGISHAEEAAIRMKGSGPELTRQAVQRYANMIGPPQPNTHWQRSINQGPFPYLLAPPALWDQLGADHAARRARILDRLVEDEVLNP